MVIREQAAFSRPLGPECQANRACQSYNAKRTVHDQGGGRGNHIVTSSFEMKTEDMDTYPNRAFFYSFFKNGVFGLYQV